MDAESAARRWRETWLRAWPGKDADAVARDDAECWFAEPVVAGDRATCEYWGVVTFQGRQETIAGVAVIRFGEDGLVVDQRDYWNAHEGPREPPPGWGG